MYYVYELVNLLGTVEYVGETTNPSHRLVQHTTIKPNKKESGHGQFYLRSDITMHIVSSYPTKEEAKKIEEELQIFWNLKTDRSKQSRKGSQHGMAKLTESQVREIKILFSQKIPSVEIAKMFATGTGTISKIKSGKLWSHVTSTLES